MSGLSRCIDIEGIEMIDLDRIKAALVAKSNQESFEGAIWFGRALAVFEPVALAAEVVRQRTNSAIAPLDFIDLCRLGAITELADPNGRYTMPDHVCKPLNLYLDSLPYYRGSESVKPNLPLASERHWYLEMMLVQAIIDEVRLTSPATAVLVEQARVRLSKITKAIDPRDLIKADVISPSEGKPKPDSDDTPSP